MGILLSKICNVWCPECNYFKSGHYYHYERLETQKCVVCGADIVIVSGKSASSVLPGGWSDDFNSELYIRPDKDHPNERARHMKWTYHKIERLEEEGKTKKVNDFQDVKERIAHYEHKDRTI